MVTENMARETNEMTDAGSHSYIRCNHCGCDIVVVVGDDECPECGMDPRQTVVRCEECEGEGTVKVRLPVRTMYGVRYPDHGEVGRTECGRCGGTGEVEIGG